MAAGLELSTVYCSVGWKVSLKAAKTDEHMVGGSVASQVVVVLLEAALLAVVSDFAVVGLMAVASGDALVKNWGYRLAVMTVDV
jgi:hypothetical protein